MKKDISNNIKLGVFVSLGVILLISGIYLIGQKQRLFSGTFRVSGVFSDVGGLQTGNNVRFLGINLGIIESIQIISDTTVRVDMILDEYTRKYIKKDAKASIGSEGMIGNKIIVISSGSPGEMQVKNNDFLETIPPMDMDDIFLKLKTTADNAATITTDLAGIMENIHSGKGLIGKLVMDTVFAETFDQTLVNLQQGTKGLKKTVDAANNSFLLKGFNRDKKPKVKTDKKNKE